jgi:uncharacterized protein
VTAAPARSDSAPAPRTLLRRSGDRALTRLLRVPPATTDYVVTRDITVPMRDGVTLLADHYAPITPSPEGTLLVRGPYGRGLPASILYARLYAGRGYHVVVQSVRGTFGSQGVFEPAQNEIADGADTVAWLRNQPWFTGRFGTVGLSYLGFTQWALLVDPPPELAAAVIAVGPHDLSAAAWGTGAFALSDFLGWSDLVAHQEDRGRIRPLIRMLTSTRRLRAAMDALPLGQAGRTLLGEGAPWYESWVGNQAQTAEFWRPMQLGAALDRAEIPVLLIGGWQDLFLDQTLDQYRRLRARGVDVALTIGPWTHLQMTTAAVRTAARETMGWFDEHLGAHPTQTRSGRVRIHVTDRWRELPDWPPAADEKTWYLHPGALLADDPPRRDTAPSRFVYDPADPTPTVGGRMLLRAAGYRNDARLAARPDVLSFTTAPLAQPLEVIGVPCVELAHTTDNPHADLSVRVDEVDARGRSRNVSDGYVRLAPEQPSPVRVPLDAIAHRFGAGCRIRLLIAGGSHPRFARNLGTDEPALTSSRFGRSTHVVGADGVSKLLLPVVSPGS